VVSDGEIDNVIQIETADMLGQVGQTGTPGKWAAFACGYAKADLDFDPYEGDLNDLIEAWLPLTFAVNSINRSMGHWAPESSLQAMIAEAPPEMMPRIFSLRAHEPDRDFYAIGTAIGGALGSVPLGFFI
jgi:hypothetical protein